MCTLHTRILLWNNLTLLPPDHVPFFDSNIQCTETDWWARCNFWSFPVHLNLPCLIYLSLEKLLSLLWKSSTMVPISKTFNLFELIPVDVHWFCWDMEIFQKLKDLGVKNVLNQFFSLKDIFFIFYTVLAIQTELTCWWLPC